MFHIPSLEEFFKRNMSGAYLIENLGVLEILENFKHFKILSWNTGQLDRLFPNCIPLFRTDFRKVSNFLILVTVPKFHSQSVKFRNQIMIGAPCSVLCVICSYFFNIYRGIEIARVVFAVLVDDMRFSPEGKSIVRPLIEKSQKMGGKRKNITLAASIATVPFFQLCILFIFVSCN